VKPKKTEVINARLSPVLRERINRINRRYGVSDTRIVEELVTAWVEAVEEEGHTWFPVQIMRPVLLPEGLVEEEQAEYKFTPKMVLRDALRKLEEMEAAAGKRRNDQ